MKYDRTRNWATLVYPESAPVGWLDLLSAQHVKALVSPLHDADVNPDGEVKKPHYHVLYMFDGVKTEKQVQELADALSAVKVQRISSIRSYARYLCHMDNPEKAQYNTADVMSFGGVDFVELVQSAADVDQTLTEIERFVDENNVLSYAALCRYARDNRQDWTRTIRTHTYHLKAYVQAVQWEYDNGLDKQPWQTIACVDDVG